MQRRGLHRRHRQQHLRRPRGRGDGQQRFQRLYARNRSGRLAASRNGQSPHRQLRIARPNRQDRRQGRRLSLGQQHAVGYPRFPERLADSRRTLRTLLDHRPRRLPDRRRTLDLHLLRRHLRQNPQRQLYDHLTQTLLFRPEHAGRSGNFESHQGGRSDRQDLRRDVDAAGRPQCRCRRLRGHLRPHTEKLDARRRRIPRHRRHDHPAAREQD